MADATVIDDAVRFVAVNANQNSNKKNEDKKTNKHIDNAERLTTNQIL